MVDDVPRLAGPYMGVGLSTFTFSFKIFEPTDVYVASAMSNDEYPTNLEYGMDYSVELNDDQDAAPGGQITLTTALVASQIIVIGSGIAYTQETQLTNYSRFPPEIINTALDRIVIQIQQIVERLGRTLQVPATSSTTPEEMIERLLSAQSEAKAYADAAATSANEAQQAAEEAKQYGENAEILKPYAAAIDTVAGSIGNVNAVGSHINDVHIVAGDLEGEDVSGGAGDEDYGEYSDEEDSGSTEVEITGGNVKIVADNIEAIRQLGQYAEDGTLEAAATSAADAAKSSALAKEWAVKMDGLVNNEDFSAKYYADQAAQQKQAVEAAGTSAISSVNSAKTSALSEVSSAQSTAVSAIESAGTTAKQSIADDVSAAAKSASDAAASATSASRSASAAQGSETAASGSASDAANSAAAAKASEDAAASSAEAATGSAASAEASASEASKSAETATTKAGEASTSASAAAQSASSAKASQDAAASSASSASGSATAAAASEKNAGASETAAAASAEAASGSAEAASASADAAEAKATEAASSATAAASSAQSASGSAQTATSKASEASSSATAAASSASAAKASQTAAENAASRAEEAASSVGDPLGREEAEQTYAKKTDLKTFTGATASSAGSSGFVPAPASGSQGSVLRGDGTWAIPKTSVQAVGDNSERAVGLLASAAPGLTELRYHSSFTYNAATRTLTVTFVSGALHGNADTATKAEQDSQGRVIHTTYATQAALTQGLTGKADTRHSHEIADVTGLQSALDEKAASSSLGTLAKKSRVTAEDLADDIDYGEYGG